MKINEILNENTGTLQPSVADALPNTTVLTDLKNTDPYEQYRMGLAIAGARAKAAGDIAKFNADSAWGENMVITAYTDAEQETLIKVPIIRFPRPSLKKQRMLVNKVRCNHEAQ